VIERAVDTGRLDKNADPDEEEKASVLGPVPDTGIFGPANGAPMPPTALTAHEDQAEDEKETERDLSYEFSMPSPLRRMMADLVGAVANIAKTFDPNATNMELSRVLLTIALGEGLEMDDPAEVVSKVFPEGYQDPAISAAMAASRQQIPRPDETGPFSGPFGQPPGGPPQGENNPYSAPMRARPPEIAMQQAVTRSREGDPIMWPIREQAFHQLPDDHRDDANMNVADAEKLFAEDVEAVVNAHLERMLLTPASSNGNGASEH
jgi:hypothetical protein